MRPAGWCQPKGRIGAAPGATEPMGERGKCLYTLKNTSKSRRSAQNTKKSISNSNNEPNFTLHEISGLGQEGFKGGGIFGSVDSDVRFFGNTHRNGEAVFESAELFQLFDSFEASGGEVSEFF